VIKDTLNKLGILLRKVIHFAFKELGVIRNLLKRLINLNSVTDYENTITSIDSNINVNGSTSLILLSSCILACIGLDTNSPAIIIGAMLISPLMSPILGIGLGIGIFKKELLFNSLKNFSVAVALSIITSTIYFTISPLGKATPEILARTNPTLLDVGVAFFGGFAGIIALSRKSTSTILPGVAIATALMPPLCTSGFGIATGNFTIFLGAFYLFFLNAVFISLSTYIIVRVLDFPYTEFFDTKVKFKIQRWIAIFSLLAILPSIIILYRLVDDYRTKIEIENIIFSKLQNGKNKIVNWEIQNKNDKNTVKVFLFGGSISQKEKQKIDSMLNKKGFTLDLMNINLTEEEKQSLTDETKRILLSNIEANKMLENRYKSEVDSLKRMVNISPDDSVSNNKLTSEIKIIYPQIEDITYAMSSGKDKKNVLIIKFNKRTSPSSKNYITNKLYSYLAQRFQTENILIADLKD